MFFIIRKKVNYINYFFKVIGTIYEVNGYKILPIYHSSPILPKSYTDNVQNFEKIKGEKVLWKN